MKKRFLSLALSLMMVCALFVPVPAFASFDTSTRESVVMVHASLEVDAGTMSFGWGSGFFVGKEGENPSHFITNYHVIEDFVNFGAGDLRGYSQDPSTGRWTIYENPNDSRAEYVGRSKIRVYYDSITYEDAFVVEYDAMRDVALLKLSSSTSRRKPIPLCLPTDDMVGSTVYAIGFPGLSENLFADATSSWDVSDCTVTRGAISRLLTTSGTGQQNIQIDCDIKHGNSGGPLVNEYSAAIGINTWSVSNNSGEQANYAVSIREAITLLDRNRVDYMLVDPTAPTPPPVESELPQVSAGVPGEPDPVPTEETPDEPSEEPSAEPSDEPSEEDEGLDPFIIVLIAAGALVVVGIVVAVVVVTRKKSSASSAPQYPPQDSAPQYPPQGSVPPTAPAQGFQPPQAPPAPTASLAGDSGLRIQGVTGSFAGRRIAIPRQLRIGRDPQRNDLVYPAGTQGISGVHCVLLVENGTVYVKDLGSTYGTFVGGRRLAANETVPLRIGDRFSLGSDRETFQIAQKGGV